MNNNQKATKRALLTSVMALVMCVVMLVGTTFAWFTDTASTGVNKIQAGNLDVELLMYKKNTDESYDYVNISKDKDPIFGSETSTVAQDNNLNTLWEPGKTQVAYLAIKNEGNLALKYKVALNVTNPVDGKDLYKVMQYAIVPDAKLDSAPVHSAPVQGWTTGSSVTVGQQPVSGEVSLGVGATHYFALLVHMDELAGNNYQNGKVDFDLTVYATQDTVENDSFNNQYDKDATYLTYPAGVTSDSFPAAADYTNDQGQTKSDKPATVAYVDENGDTKYAADLNTAITNGASVIYCKKDAKLVGSLTRGNGRTGELTSDLTIYANGADFQNTEISINATSLSTESVGKTKNFTLRVNDAKNIRIWGATPNDGVTQNIILENCTFEGKGINSDDDVASGGIFYLTGSTGTVNLTMNNCKVSKSNQAVYLGCDGNITVTNSAFEECAAGMKISHKATGGCNVTVKDTTFNKCGWDTVVANKSWLTDDSSSIKCKTKGTMTLTLDNVAITNVVGSNSIVVDGDTGYTGTTTVNATNVTVDGTTWSATNP